MTSISADEVNFLIRRYLQESGFHHTAYMFNSESLLDQTGLTNIEIPPQSLITILKKGMLYMQLEKAINEQSISSDSPENIINSILENVKGYDNSNQNNRIPQRGKTPNNSEMSSNDSGELRNTPKQPEPTIIDPENVISLRGHRGPVFCGNWSKDGKSLATGSADATVIVWEIKDNKYMSHIMLDHATKQERTEMDITAVAWNKAGTLLASCCYDGTSRLWTNKGELKFLLQKHIGSVFTVQFSPDDEIMLTGAMDGKVIAWNVRTGNEIQVFTNHTKRINDIDWLDNKTFASASNDLKICVCEIGQQKPLFVLTGHQNDINKIAWDRSKKILASCSDDKTIKIYRPYDRLHPVTLEGHKENVYIIKWMPGPQKILASGGFDNTVRVWDTQNFTCLYTLTSHSNHIFALSFSPTGEYFVSGSSDMKVYIWRTSDGAMIASYTASGGVFEIEWNPNGQNIAAFLSDATVALIPTNIIPVLKCN